MIGDCCSVNGTLNTEDSDAKIKLGEISKMLENFGVDVVLVAPVCKQIVCDFALPQSWLAKSSNMAVEQVVLTAKPAEALNMIRTKSWLSQRPSWQLDGMLR